MASVDLTPQEWNQVLTIIGNTRDFSWSITNPLLMKLGRQLERQMPINKQTNSEEVPINIGEMGVKQ